MVLRPPPRCPDDAYVNERLYELLRSRIDDPAHLVSSLSLYIRRIHLGKLLSLYEAYRLVTELPGSVVELGVFKGESLLFFGKLMELLNVNDRLGGWSSANYREELLALINAFDHDRLLYESTLAGLRSLYPLVVEGGVVLLDEEPSSSFRASPRRSRNISARPCRRSRSSPSIRIRAATSSSAAVSPRADAGARRLWPPSSVVTECSCSPAPSPATRSSSTTSPSFARCCSR